MTTITQNERAMLIAIAHDEMSTVNGNPKFAKSKSDLDCWSNIENWDAGKVTTLNGKKGVLSSLAQKDLVVADGEGREATISFTDEGFAIVMGLIAEASIVAETAPVEAKPATPKKPATFAKNNPDANPKTVKSVKVPEPDRKPFAPKAGTKRALAYEALIRPEGCTLTQAVEMLGWGRSVCGSEFWEVAKLAKRKLVRDGDVYRLEEAK
jgi:hypothetical protein